MKWTLDIPGWHATRLNLLLGNWRRAHRLKRHDADVITRACLAMGVTAAAGKRRVSLTIVLAPRQRAGDPDSYFKASLDALVRAGALRDDNRQSVELAPVTFERGPFKRTVLVIEEVEE